MIQRQNPCGTAEAVPLSKTRVSAGCEAVPSLSIPVTAADFDCRSRESLLACHSDADSFLRRDEVIDTLSILSNGELDALDVT